MTIALSVETSTTQRPLDNSRDAVGDDQVEPAADFMRVLVFIAASAVAASSTSAFGQDTEPRPAQAQHQHPVENSMALFTPREASGTAWLPDETPMYGIARRWRGWDVMLHGNAFGQFLYEPGDKHRTGGFSNKQISSVNWGMAMARRPWGAGRRWVCAQWSALSHGQSPIAVF